MTIYFPWGPDSGPYVNYGQKLQASILKDVKDHADGGGTRPGGMSTRAYSQLHLCCSCTGRHKNPLALRSLRLFSLDVFFIKSVFRKVYSLVHVCFNFIQAHS